MNSGRYFLSEVLDDNVRTSFVVDFFLFDEFDVAALSFFVLSLQGFRFLEGFFVSFFEVGFALDGLMRGRIIILGNQFCK